MNIRNIADSALEVKRKTHSREQDAARQAALAWPGYVGTLIATVQEDEDPATREWAIKELALLRDSLGTDRNAAIKAFCSRLGQSETVAKVRVRAIRALMRVATDSVRSHEATIQLLSNCLTGDPDVTVQRWALAAICLAAANGNEEAIRHLNRAADNERGDQTLRDDAKEALKDLKIPRDVPRRKWRTVVMSAFGLDFVMNKSPQPALCAPATANVHTHSSQGYYWAISQDRETLRIKHDRYASGQMLLIVFNGPGDECRIALAPLTKQPKDTIVSLKPLGTVRSVAHVQPVNPTTLPNMSEVDLRELVSVSLQMAARNPNETLPYWRKWADNLPQETCRIVDEALKDIIQQ